MGDDLKIQRLTIAQAFHLALLLSCLFLCLIYYVNSKTWGGEDIIYIAPVFNSEGNYFSERDIEQLGEILSDGLISYERIDNVTVKSSNKIAYGKSIYTTHSYFDMNNISFINGGGWSESYNDSRVAVLSEGLAWELFGSLNVVGNFIEIDNADYEICGISVQNNLESGRFLWIPFESSETEGFSDLYFKDSKYNKLGSILKVQEALAEIGKLQQDYHVADINQYRSNILLRLIVSILAILSFGIIILSVKLFGRTDTANKRFFTILSGVLIVVLSLCVIFILQFIKANIWVTNTPFSVKSFASLILNIDALPPKEYLPYFLVELTALNEKSNIAFFISIFAFFNIIISSIKFKGKAAE